MPTNMVSVVLSVRLTLKWGRPRDLHEDGTVRGTNARVEPSGK